MNNFETNLRKMSVRHIIMVYSIIIFLVIFTINILSSPLNEKKETLISEIETLHVRISNNKNGILKKEISTLSNELVLLKNKVEIEKEKITFLIDSLYKIKYAFFNENEFANTLDEVLKSSITTKLNINYIKNLPLGVDENIFLLKHKKRLEISGSGGYKEILMLMNHIRNLDMLMKLENLLLSSSEETVTFKFTIDLFGIGL